MKKTKIICTLGPSSNNESVLREMLLNGMNVARFNFSHGSHDEHRARMDLFRKVRDELKIPAALLLDTKGPEIRLKEFENGGVVLNSNDKFTLTTLDIKGTEEIVSITYADLPKQAYKGCKILIDDGKVELVVESFDEHNIYCLVTSGGKIGNRKGVNVPSVHLNLPVLSDVDKRDLLFGIEQNVDFVAASFVRNANDVHGIREFLDVNGGESIQIISKIENQEGIDNFEEILEASDGIMIARGDMGVEIDCERLPGIQKRFINRCCQEGKLVITATQMLESMITNPTPTRAEISDVANAVYDGTSAIMLSGESANGKFPAEAVKMMNRIAIKAESDAFELSLYRLITPKIVAGDPIQAISHATCTTAKDVEAAAIITVTESGNTARRISKFRPQEPIIALTPSPKTYYQLALCRGVYPVLSMTKSSVSDLFTDSIIAAKAHNFVAEGDVVVVTAGIPIGTPGATNILKVDVVPKTKK